MSTAQAKQALTQDASNRALRTFLVGLAVDTAVGIATFVLANINAISDETSLITFGLSLAKTVVTSACSFVLRRFLDGSSFPTPLPPAVPSPPATLDPAP